MKIIKLCLQPLFLLSLTVFVLVHTDNAETEIIGVRVDDKFSSAKPESLKQKIVTIYRPIKTPTIYQNPKTNDTGMRLYPIKLG